MPSYLLRTDWNLLTEDVLKIFNLFIISLISWCSPFKLKLIQMTMIFRKPVTKHLFQTEISPIACTTKQMKSYQPILQRCLFALLLIKNTLASEYRVQSVLFPLNHLRMAFIQSPGVGSYRTAAIVLQSGEGTGTSSVDSNMLQMRTFKVRVETDVKYNCCWEQESSSSSTGGMHMQFPTCTKVSNSISYITEVLEDSQWTLVEGNHLPYRYLHIYSQKCA